MLLLRLSALEIGGDKVLTWFSFKLHTWHLIPYSLVLFQWDSQSDDLAENQMRNNNAGYEN